MRNILLRIYEPSAFGRIGSSYTSSYLLRPWKLAPHHLHFSCVAFVCGNILSSLEYVCDLESPCEVDGKFWDVVLTERSYADIPEYSPALGGGCVN